MKFWTKSRQFWRTLFSTRKMDAAEQLEPIDMVAYVTEELQGRYKTANGAAAQAQVFQDFLKRWEADSSLDIVRKQHIEFQKDLDWFNVSQPLTMEGLRGKLVVLDFFTYCCINCMHILPELSALEKRYPIEHGLVVVGVHSPKFENEKAGANIGAAAERYNIEHPIVNDPHMSLWRDIGVRCWPTLLVLSPMGAPLIMLMGEGHATFLDRFCEQALRFFGQRGELKDFSLPLRASTDLLPASKLRFPAKIARSDESNFAIADAGNHRILIVNPSGDVLKKIGSGEMGLSDGNIASARFNSPQGVVFLTNEILIVADTENHAIRQVNLSSGLVETLAGVGQQGHDRVGGKVGPAQVLSSPWDLAVFRTRDMDMSFHLDEQNVPEKTIILISMAGTHQIWGYFPEGMIWWKFQKISDPCTCVALVGNGSEENRNNSYPHKAAFAQPSGLAIAKDFLFIADSESSSIRKVSMVDGKVLAVVGGDRNPQNLFAFGDVDGKQYAAKLQHPLGLTYNHINNRVYVADTYNHKIKMIDPETNVIETLAIKRSDVEALQNFNEPAGLCADGNGKYLLVADTNNHQILRVDLETLKAQPFLLNFLYEQNECVTDGPMPKRLELIKRLPLSRCKQLKLDISIRLDNQLKFTAEAPQKWSINTANTGLTSLETKGTLEQGKLLLQLHRSDMGIAPTVTKENITLALSLSLCDSKSCMMKGFTLVLDDELSLSSTDNLKADDCNIDVLVTPSDISLC